MSNDEIERRLGDLEPTGPRRELRAEILDAVQEELDSEQATSRLDHLLARRTSWAAAAILLVGLAVANVGLERGHAHRRALLMAAGTSLPPTARAFRLARTEDQLVAVLGEESRPFVRTRLRGVARTGGGTRSLAERKAWLRHWMKGESS